MFAFVVVLVIVVRCYLFGVVFFSVSELFSVILPTVSLYKQHIITALFSSLTPSSNIVTDLLSGYLFTSDTEAI